MAERTFHAPGRVNLMGEHTDYSGGRVLPVAIDRGVSLTAVLGGDRIRLVSSLEDETVDVPADGGEPGQGWGRYVAALAAELARLGREPVGLEGGLTSNLPTGAGLSSSAALEMAVAIALCAAAEFELEPMDLVRAGQRAEHRAVGVPSGIMDQAASLLGRRGHALLLDCGTLEHRHVPLPEDLALLIIDSGTARTLEGSGYAQRRAELEEGLAALDGRDPKAVDVDEAMLQADRAGLADVPRRRLLHVVTENARVLAVEAALRGDAERDAGLGRLFAEGHASLRDDFEVSTSELDLLVDLALEHGAVAARMTGGGFGGAIVALVDSERATAVGESVVLAYGDRTDARAAALVCEAADGAGER